MMQALAGGAGSHVPVVPLNSDEFSPEWCKVSDGSCECEVAIATITHSTARKLLDSMPRNRGVKKSNVLYIARQMNKNDWGLTGQAIILDQDGNLIDGQHRCHACLSSGKSFTTLVVRGIARQQFSRIDTGSRRSAGDVLAIDGIHDSGIIASTMVLLLRYRNYGLWWEPSGGTSPSHEEIRTQLENFPDLDKAVLTGRAVSKVIGVSPSHCATMVWLTRKIDRPKADEFWGSVITGVGLGQNDLERLFRERMLQFRAARNFKPTAKAIAGLFARSWNAFRQGRKMAKLQALAPGEAVPDLI